MVLPSLECRPLRVVIGEAGLFSLAVVSRLRTFSSDRCNACDAVRCLCCASNCQCGGAFYRASVERSERMVSRTNALKFLQKSQKMYLQHLFIRPLFSRSRWYNAGALYFQTRAGAARPTARRAAAEHCQEEEGRAHGSCPCASRRGEASRASRRTSPGSNRARVCRPPGPAETCTARWRYAQCRPARRDRCCGSRVNRSPCR